jgi:Pvc16 N-terminal domain
VPDGFALAALSHALRTRIRSGITDAADVQQTGQFDVVSKAPDQLATANLAKATLTIYPWKLVPNSSWASSRQSAYSPSGDRRASPLLALDVIYVLGAYAQDNAVAETVLGIALLTLHETPQLSRETLQAQSAATFPNGSPLPQALRDLAAQAAPITVEPLNWELEPFSQAWGTFHSGVRAGMFYRVGTLLMESRRRAASAPPVREGRLAVTLLRAPQIVRMLFAATSAGPFAERSVALPGELLRIEGSGLKGDITALAIGAVIVAVPVDGLRADRIEVALPATLRPGLVTLQVVQQWPKPAGGLPPPAAGTIPGERSNLVPLAIRPVLRATTPYSITNRQVGGDGSVSFDVTARFAVNVGNRQRFELMLNAVAAGPDGRFASFAFAAPDPAPGLADASVNARVVQIRGVPAGQYLARVVLDGAESALSEDGAGITGPKLAVPA